MISIIVCSDEEQDKRLTVHPAQPVHAAIVEGFGCERKQQVQRVLFGDTDVLEGESFEDHGIEVWRYLLPPVYLARRSQQLTAGYCCVLRHQDGARLSVSIKTRLASLRDVAEELVACNPVAVAAGLTVEILMGAVELDPEDASHVLGSLKWSCTGGIVVLPESIGDLTVDGGLCLNNNQLESLPESFGNLTVDGGLRLQGNKLESLPESFGSLTVGGDLYLHNNTCHIRK